MAAVDDERRRVHDRVVRDAVNWTGGRTHAGMALTAIAVILRDAAVDLAAIRGILEVGTRNEEGQGNE